MFHLRAMPVALVLVLTGLSISSGLAGEWPVATSADGKYVVCSVDNGGVYVVRDADTLAEIRRGGSQMKMAVPFFSGDGKRLFVLNLGNPPTIRVERPSDGREIASFGLPADASYKFLVADERGSRLAVAVTKREGSGRNITLDSSGMVLIDVDKGGREVARIAPTTAAGDVVEPRRGTTFIESGRQLLVAHWKSGLDLYDANSGELVRTVSSDGVCYPSPDGSRYLQVSGARDNEVAELIETDGGRKLMTLPVAPPGYMDAVWSPDGKWCTFRPARRVACSTSAETLPRNGWRSRCIGSSTSGTCISMRGRTSCSLLPTTTWR